jgi:N-acyl amino acid synthase of PEP-CTERM/exosortase system
MHSRGKVLSRGNSVQLVGPNARKPNYSLYSDYDALFETRIADTPRLREECFRVRHEVYCVERGFLTSHEKSNGLERDSFDERSIHSLLYDRETGLAIGTIRLILADRASPTRSTPFHSLCKDRLANHPELLGVSQTAEVSRLALSKSRCDRASFSTGQRRRSTDLKDIHPSSYVALGLLRMAIEMAVKNHVDYLCCVMEPSLLRMLGRCGIYFENLGECIEYHGRRQPCYAHMVTMLDGVKANRPDVWEILTDIGRFQPDRWQAKRYSQPALEPQDEEISNLRAVRVAG